MLTWWHDNFICQYGTLVTHGTCGLGRWTWPGTSLIVNMTFSVAAWPEEAGMGASDAGSNGCREDMQTWN